MMFDSCGNGTDNTSPERAPALRRDMKAELKEAARIVFQAGQELRLIKTRWAAEYAQAAWEEEFPGVSPCAGSFIVDPLGCWCFWMARDETGKNTWAYQWH